MTELNENTEDHSQAETQMASTSAGNRENQMLLGNKDLLLLHILYKNDDYTTYISPQP